jgi:hypothetical protein
MRVDGGQGAGCAGLAFGRARWGDGGLACLLGGVVGGGPRVRAGAR